MTYLKTNTKSFVQNTNIYFVINILLLAAVFAMLTWYVFSVNGFLSQGLKIKSLDQRIKKLNEENKFFQLQISESLSPEFLKDYVTDQLKMEEIKKLTSIFKQKKDLAVLSQKLQY